MRDDLYVLVCAARTGSSFLETSLLSHPEIMSHGEVFAQRVSSLRGRYGEMLKDAQKVEALTALRNRFPADFLFKYAFDTQGRKAAGFKFKYEEMLLPKYAAARETIRRNPDIKIIHLSRMNLFKRMMSHWIATRVSKITEIHAEKDRPRIEPFAIPVSACEQDFMQVEARYHFVRRLLKDHRQFEVTYENLVGDDGATIAAIQEFIGVEPQPLQSRLKKVVVDRPEDLVSNYGELKAHFAGTRYAEFFGEDA